MKITFVAKKLNVGGGGSNFSLDLIARTVMANGHTARILTLEPESNDLPQAPPYDVIESPYEPFKTRVGMARKIKQKLERFESDTDVYHLFNPTFMTGGGLYRGRQSSVPVICRLNNYTVFCTNTQMMDGECYKNCTTVKKVIHSNETGIARAARLPFYFSRTHIGPKIASNIDRFFAQSPEVATVYSHFGIDKQRIRVVPNFYDPDFGTDTQVQKKGGKKPNDPIRVVYVGRLVHAKGIDILLRALEHLDISSDLPDSALPEVEIIGEGPERPMLEELSRDLGIDDSVCFRGGVPHDEIAEYYGESTALIHPCRWPEPFNRTLLEAMQQDCLLIVSDVGGPPWVVGDAGITFEPENYIELAEAIEKVATDEDLVQNKRARNEGRLRQFSPEKVTNLILDEYTTWIKSSS